MATNRKQGKKSAIPPLSQEDRDSFLESFNNEVSGDDGKAKLGGRSNVDNSQNLPDFARYFGNAKMGAQARISELDSQGFTLTYIERSHDMDAQDGGAGLLQRKEVRVQWNSPASTLFEVERQMKLIISEVKSALYMQMNVDKTYIPPGREGPLVLWENPSVGEYIFTLLYWIFFWLCTQPFFMPSFITDALIQGGAIDGIAEGNGGPGVMSLILLALFCIHSGLAFTVFAMGLYNEFPLQPLLKWAGLTVFFGFMTARRAVKIAYKYKFKMDATSSDNENDVDEIGERKYD